MEQVPKIVQQRLRNAARPEAHPDANMLTAFSEKLLGERDRTQVLGHLAECAVCREMVALANVAKGDAPEVVPTPSARARWLSWPVLRWGTAAACVVVVGTTVILHYEWRAEERPHATAEVSAPAAAPPTVTLKSREIGTVREKLAAKIPPPSPGKSDPDLALVGKLAKQSGTANGRTVDHEVIDRLQTVANEPSGVAPQNELANSISVVAGAGAPATVRQQATAAAASAPARVPAPAPVSPPAAKAAELDAKQRDDLSKVGTVTETVTVEAEATQINTESASSKPVDKSVVNKSMKDEEAKKAQKATAGTVGGIGLENRKADMASAEMNRAQGSSAETITIQSKKSKSRAEANATARWTVSPDGGLQRSFGAGRTWQTVPVAQGVVFRALAANDSDIWAGGTGGALYHSSDAGQTWTQVKPMADGKTLTGNIIHLEFDDPQHGKLTTDKHETWITTDSGQTWRVQ